MVVVGERDCVDIRGAALQLAVSHVTGSWRQERFGQRRTDVVGVEGVFWRLKLAIRAGGRLFSGGHGGTITWVQERGHDGVEVVLLGVTRHRVLLSLARQL